MAGDVLPITRRSVTIHVARGESASRRPYTSTSRHDHEETNNDNWKAGRNLGSRTSLRLPNTLNNYRTRRALGVQIFACLRPNRLESVVRMRRRSSWLTPRK
jgi:hypothetical protein